MLTLTLVYADLVLSLDLKKEEAEETVQNLLLHKVSTVVCVDEKSYILSSEGLRYAVLEEKKETTP